MKEEKIKEKYLYGSDKANGKLDFSEVFFNFYHHMQVTICVC